MLQTAVSRGPSPTCLPAPAPARVLRRLCRRAPTSLFHEGCLQVPASALVPDQVPELVRVPVPVPVWVPPVPVRVSVRVPVPVWVWLRVRVQAPLMKTG